MPIRFKVDDTEITEYEFDIGNQWELATPVEFEIHNDATQSNVITDIKIPTGFVIVPTQDVKYNLAADESTHIVLARDTGLTGTFVGTLDVTYTLSPQLSQLELTGITESELPALPVYTSRARLEAMYGREQILVWADKTGRRRVLDVQRTIDYYIAQRSRRMDAELRGGKLAIPFENPIPDVIANLCTAMAGVDLYSSLGVFNEQLDKRLHTVRKSYYADIATLKQGRMFLGTEMYPTPTSL